MPLEDRDSSSITIPLAECRDQQRAVGEIEVYVGRRHALALVGDGSRHRQLDNLERIAVLIACLVEGAAGFLQDRVIWIALVALDPDGDRARIDEAREIVDVAIGVVALDALAEPDHVLLAVVVAQVFLDALLRYLGVAIPIQQTR